MPTCQAELDVDTARGITAEAFVPAGTQRWGLEVERIVHRVGDRAERVPYAELCSLEGLLPSGSRVTLEPGGQVEISTAPAPDLDALLDGLTADTVELDARLSSRGLRAVDRALDIARPPRRVLAQPRYQAMEAFFDARGGAGRWMMCNTAALQINLSHDPAGSSRRWQVLHAIAPVLLATFANSPGLDRARRSWASLRQGIWQTIDPARTSAPCLTGPPERAWADYVLAADVMMIRTGGDAIAVPPGLPFAHWLKQGHPAGWPTADDLRYHMTTLFPPVRPRGWLEIRVIDALPPQVREIAVLTVAAAAEEELAGELLRQLPDTRSWWTAAARAGLADDQLASAAATLFDITARALPRLTSRLDRIKAVTDYRSSHVLPRVQPWGGSMTDAALDLAGVPELDGMTLSTV
jgi:glutamate--cysteine ligase